MQALKTAFAIILIILPVLGFAEPCKNLYWERTQRSGEFATYRGTVDSSYHLITVDLYSGNKMIGQGWGVPSSSGTFEVNVMADIYIKNKHRVVFSCE